MHLHFERNANARCDCTILSLSWMGKVPDELPEEEGWKLNRNNYYQEGWLATGNLRGLVGVTFTTSHSRRGGGVELPLRTNYNLRGHRSEVILVKWNEPYQKLASCDKSGVIFVWIKYEGRWSIELINDRSTPVTHFSWSHDGRMALICYQDGFVLVGSVAGQRYWSSMLTLEARITCGCWTPDDLHVYLGTAAAQLVVMDVHGAMVSQVQLNSEGGITAMAWSCEKFKMEEGDAEEGGGAAAAAATGHVLAVACGGGEVVFLRGYDDVSPARAHTGLDGSTLAMEWANTRELLAVAGSVLPDVNNPEPTCFKNMVKFYSDTANLIYTVVIPYTQARVSALTWGHAGRRLFVACGGAVQTARVWRVVAPLQLLARVRAAQALSTPAAAASLPLPPKLRPLVANLFAHTIRCCVPEPAALRRFVSRVPGGATRLHCTMLRHEEDEEAGGGGGGGGGAYTLYLEHLGGLVPLLKGRRTSKIRPEFVIFDPQAENGDVIERIRVSSSSSSSSGGSGGSASSTSSGGAPARAAPRRPHARATSDSSDTEHEEAGCSGSPRLQRKRRAKEKRKHRSSSERERRELTDELAYIDSLPEDVRLVEVTSNIWGTKFKMHGIAKNVPANLGQVTYKTSLLHLQPRQMTLAITELRDDCNPETRTPDPNFNPNVFSEDEEESIHTTDAGTSPPHGRINDYLGITGNNNTTNQFIQTESTNTKSVASLARAESLEELPHEQTNGFSDAVQVHVPPPQPRHAHTTVERRVSATTSVTSRHAISPLRCDGSVPTLQSPKNAVAPTDIIFERPSPQTVTCGGRGDFCGGRADYTVRGDNINLKTNISSVEQPSFSLNLTAEPSRHITIKKTEAHINEGCLSKLRKNICSKGESTYEVNTRIIKTITKNYENEVHPDAMNRRAETLRSLQKVDDLKFIDEEAPLEGQVNANVIVREVKARTPTAAVAISPVCAPVPFYMSRSCSVGYLDLVDPQLLKAGLSVAALRKEEPRRLILVNRKKRNHRRQRQLDIKDTIEEAKQPLGPSDIKLSTLKICGKSRSLDSSELPIAPDNNNTSRPITKLEITNVELANNNLGTNLNNNPAEGKIDRNIKVSFTGIWTPQPRRKSRKDYPVCTRCRLVSPYDRRDVADLTTYVCVACSSGAGGAGGATTAPRRLPALPALPALVARDADSDTDYSKYYSSLEQLALRLRAARGAAAEAGGAGRGAAAGRAAAAAAAREVASAPASPRPERSNPASPAPHPRRPKRNSSASPIRQLLDSPLLTRRHWTRKKHSESSDEEASPGGAAAGGAVGAGGAGHYRDLESFQRQQLKNKLKRGGGSVAPGEGGGAAAARRQLVMHNKAPMWNENSQVYQLDFGGRVTQESAKNFQIEFHGKQVMQFGRIDGKAYTLDFQYPFSALQAFAVALANVTQRLK